MTLLVDTLRQKPNLPRPPVWLMRQAGRYLPEYRALRAQHGDFMQLCFNAPVAAELTMQPIRRFNPDAAIVFADILTIPQALGQAVRFDEGVGPVLTPIRTAAQVAQLNLAQAAQALAPVGDTLRLLKQQLPPHVALIGFAGLPRTVLSYMVEGGSPHNRETLRKFDYTDPALVYDLQELVINATIDYLSMQVHAGADVLQLFDSHVAQLPHALFDKHVIAPTQRIVAALKQQFAHVPIIGFPRGAGNYLHEYAQQTGVDAVSCDIGTSVATMQQLQKHTCVQGNLDPYMLFGSVDVVRQQTLQLCQHLQDGPHIVNLGHGILPQTPPEAVAAMIETVQGFTRHNA